MPRTGGGRKRKAASASASASAPDNETTTLALAVEGAAAISEAGDHHHPLLLQQQLVAVRNDLLKLSAEAAAESEVILRVTSEPSASAAALESLSEDELSQVWDGLEVALARAAGHLQGGGAADEAKEVVAGICQMAKWSVVNLERHQELIPQGLLASAKLLHGLLLTESRLVDNALKNDLCVLLETWRKRELPEAESLAENVFVHLLQRATTNKGTKSDVARLWAIHQTLLNFRPGEAEEDLLKAVKSENFVRSPDGVRFIVFLFTISPAFVERIHAAIKSALRPEEK